MYKYYIILTYIFFVSCKKTSQDSTTYFGGKIINPKCDYVVLFKQSKVLDTIKFTANNRFMTKLTNIKSGLYLFKHGVEHQYVYLEPNDSVLIRLNTWGFDESLRFSGVGANKNNALIETFLQNEQDDRDFMNYYEANVGFFGEKVDAIKKEKEKFFNNFKLENPNVSQGFLDILKIGLEYPLHTKIENYIRESVANKSEFKVDSSFLVHRKVASLNKDSLMFYIPYRKYVYANLYSDVYQRKLDGNSSQFIIALLHDIGKKIHAEKQRNGLLRHVVMRYLYDNCSDETDNEIYNTFASLSSNKQDQDRIFELLNDLNKISINTKIPDFTVINANGDVENIEDLIKEKKSLIYFRGKTKSSSEWLATRVNYLMNTHDDTNFIIINVDDERDRPIQKLSFEYQYSLDKKSEAYNFLQSKFPRAILVDKNGIVNTNFASLTSKNIEKKLKGL